MTATKEPRRRPGGRTARTTEAVHGAVLALIAEGGAARVQVPDVAERSGVHASTIYRRWGSPVSLVLDVALDRLGAAAEVPATGSLRGDLLTYARRTLAATEGPEGFALLHAVVSACDLTGKSEGAGMQHLHRRGTEIQAMLDRHPGDAPTLEDVLDGVLAPVYLRVLFNAGGMDDTYVEKLVDRLLPAGA
uniref:TetR/AcrR family transcriptional regulator n=1 Tax=Streptomyces sp. NBC_01401 TaxID=2903854 RepID=A0AAU3GQA3_9ACTN